MATRRIVRGVRPVPEEALARALPPEYSVEVVDYLRDLERRFRQVQTIAGDTQILLADGVAPGPPGDPGGPGPPGPPAPGTEPDLTPPPTPSGLTVSAGFANIFIQWDAATYSQGHGNLQTNIYGAKYTSGPLPTFAAAVLIASPPQPDAIYAHPTELSTTWHIWIKFQSRDGIESTAPAGGTNGQSATTGAIGTNDLGPLIVEAGNLASGSVTASKIATAALEFTKFAAGIEPVGIVNALPNPVGYTGPKAVFLTTDNKLYRYTGTAWTTAVATVDLLGQITSTQITDQAITTPKLAAGAVTANQIAADTITANQIATGAITANELAANSVIAGKIAAAAVSATQIAAGAIQTDKLLVTGRGAALNDDPNFQDLSAWTLFSGNVGAFVNVADGSVGSTALQSGTAGPVGSWYNSRRVPFDPAKTYRIRGRARNNGAGDGRLFIGVALFDSPGNNIAGDGTQWFYPVNNAIPTVGWTAYSAEFGANTTRPFPSTARTMAALVILNYNSTTGTMQAQDLRLEEKTAADLIVDGSIIASKLAANAIAVGSAAIQDGAIVNAMIRDATIDTAKIATLAAGKITAGSLLVGAFIQSSDYVNNVAGWRIHGNGSAEFGAAVIRGQLTAAQIDTRGLDIRTPGGAIILSASDNLDFTRINPSGGWLNENIRQNRNWVRNTNTWTFFGSGANLSGGNEFYNGRYVHFPSLAAPPTSYAQSPSMSLTNGQTYTVSFVAWSDVPGRNLIVDLFPDTLPEVVVPLTTTPTLYKYPFTLAHADAANCVMRAFPAGAQAGQIIFGNPQIELGTTYTTFKPALEDEVTPANQLTPANATTFIANAAIKSAMIETLTADKITTGTLTGQTLTGGTIQTNAPGNNKRIVLNESNSNEARFYGDRGDGTFEMLASIGITGPDLVIGQFGTSSAANNRAAVWGQSGSGWGVRGNSSSNAGVWGESSSGIGGFFTSVSNAAVRGIAQVNSAALAAIEGVTNPGVAAKGVAGYSNGSGPAIYGGPGVSGSTGYGAEYIGNATRAPLRLQNAYTTPPSIVEFGGIAMIRSLGGLGTFNLCFSDGSQWLKVKDLTTWDV